MFFLSARHLFGLIGLYSLGLLGFGLYLQHVVGLEPCPMCIMQRYALLLLAVISVTAAMHGPRRPLGVRIYAGVAGALAVAGGVVAAQQSWLQRFPPPIVDCGPGLDFMLERYSLAEALPMIFRGTGDCSVIDWSLFGLSIANWSLLNFALFTVLFAWLLKRGRL